MRATYQWMDPIGLAELRALLAERRGPCVSIFMPILSQGGADLQTEPLRLQKLLEQAEKRLLASGLSAMEVQAMLAPALPYEMNSHPLWQHPNAGLALFLAADLFTIYRLPLVFDEQLSIGPHCLIKPLLPLFSGDGCFYLLTLSQNNVRFFKGSRHSMEKCELADIPHSLAEARRFDEVQLTRQVHSAASSGIGGRHTAPVYTGQGSAGDEKLIKKELEQFLHEVAQGVNHQLAGQTAPLLVAGVDVMRGLYREVNHYRYLLDAPIDGNSDKLSAEELHARAWPLVAPIFQEPYQKATALYHQFLGQESTHASHTVRLALLHAYEKRVDSLLVKAGAEQWGTFDPTTLAISVHRQQETGDDDLLNLAAIYTLQNGGAAYLVEPNEMPNYAPVAAVLRY